jgi:hypothetical protein
VAAAFARAQPGAEEQFYDQTPWANPQHPANHALYQQQRKASLQFQENVESGSADPASTEGQHIYGRKGRTPTIAEGSSRPSTQGLFTSPSSHLNATETSMRNGNTDVVATGP